MTEPKMISVVVPTEPESDPNSFHIKVLRGPYEGVTYKFGDVSFSEDNEEPMLHFSYDLIEGELSDKIGFEKFIGDELIKMIEEQLKEQSVVYRGGK